jgi:sRNA-binding regulator protein Hfq
MDSTAVGRAPEQESFGNRKLIRPTLSREPREAVRANENGDRERRSNGGAVKKTPAPDQTHAENFYYQKQMQSKTPMVFVLQDGEEVHGVIEWYDRTCLKITRNNSANLLIYKPSIKYMYKEGEMSGRK